MAAVPVATPAPTKAATAPVAEPKAAESKAVAPTADAVVVKDVRFTGNAEAAYITVDLPKGAHATVDDRSPKTWVLEIHGAVVPKSLERSLDASAYGSVVRMVSTYQASTSPAVVNVAASLSGPATQKLTEQGTTLVWTITGESKPTTVATVATPQTAGFAAEAQVIAASTPTQTRQTHKKSPSTSRTPTSSTSCGSWPRTPARTSSPATTSRARSPSGCATCRGIRRSTPS